MNYVLRLFALVPIVLFGLSNCSAQENFQDKVMAASERGGPGAPGSSPCNAIVIDPGACITVNNTGTVGTSMDPGCAGFLGVDLWYAAIVPASGAMIVSTAGTGDLEDTGLALYRGDNCDSPFLIGCSDDHGAGYFSRLFVTDRNPGDTIWIQVFGYNGIAGEFLLCLSDPGVVVFESSELPIVTINTLGQNIINEPKIHALMGIKYNGLGNLTYLTDPDNIYSGDIGIEIRGATSSGYLQKPYAVETRDPVGSDLDVSLFGMPAENDWVLLSNYNDRSLVKNQLGSWIFTRMGNYAPRLQLCEVLVNGSYRGIQVFGEKIKRDAGRVDIAKLTGLENSGDDVTGGYIISQNYWTPATSFQSNYSPIDHPNLDIHFNYVYPKIDTITVQQRSYIAAFVDSLETALYGPDFMDPEIGYRKYLDVPSFIDYFLVNEVARNSDGFKKSVYFHKDKNSNGGKLKAGPVWDFDWAWKTINDCHIFWATDGSEWSHEVNDCIPDNNSCGWYIRLLQDPLFRNELHCAYQAYRLSVLNTLEIDQYIDSIAARVQNAKERHFQKWPILGVSGPAPDVGSIPETYGDEITALKAWIAMRIAWLDDNMPGLCQTSGVGEVAERDPLTFFPNPSTGRVTIQGRLQGGSAGLLLMYDVTGRSISTIPIASGTVSVDHIMPGSGTYYFKLYENSALVQTGKLVVL